MAPPSGGMGTASNTDVPNRRDRVPAYGGLQIVAALTDFSRSAVI